MSVAEAHNTSGFLLASLLGEESFYPAEPRSLAETGLPESLVEGLICKYLAVVGTASGRGVAKNLCLPFGILEEIFRVLRARQIVVHTGSAPLNDYNYTLTDQGRDRAKSTRRAAPTSARAGAARRLHRLGRGPDDPGRVAQAAAAGEGLRRHLGRARNCSRCSARR